MRVLIEFHSSMGDCILDFPILHALRDSGRLSWVEVVVRSPCDALLENYDWVNRIHVRDRGLVSRFRPALNSVLHPFDLRLYLRRRRSDDPGAWFVRARRTLGVESCDRSLKPEGVIPHRLSILRTVLGEDMPVVPRVLISLPAGRRETVFSKAGFPDGARVLAVGPGAGKPVKVWPEDRFVRLIDALGPQFDDVALVGSPGEQGLCDRIAARTGATSLAGRLQLTETAALLGSSRLYVGNDSALAHLAASEGCPSVSIGPRYKYFTPWQGYAVMGDVGKIEVGEVLGLLASHDLLSGSSAPGAVPSDTAFAE